MWCVFIVQARPHWLMLGVGPGVFCILTLKLQHIASTFSTFSLLNFWIYDQNFVISVISLSSFFHVKWNGTNKQKKAYTSQKYFLASHQSFLKTRKIKKHSLLLLFFTTWKTNLILKMEERIFHQPFNVGKHFENDCRNKRNSPLQSFSTELNNDLKIKQLLMFDYNYDPVLFQYEVINDAGPDSPNPKHGTKILMLSFSQVSPWNKNTLLPWYCFQMTSEIRPAV